MPYRFFWALVLASLVSAGCSLDLRRSPSSNAFSPQNAPNNDQKTTLTTTSACDPLPPPPATDTIINVDPSQTAQLPSIVSNAQPHTTILLADGTYALNGAGLVLAQPYVTLRSKSGNREAVILDGGLANGAYQSGEIVGLWASYVTVADITIQHALNHPIHVQPPNGSTTGTLIHNVHLIDPGEQAIKVNAGNGTYSDYGEVRCSHIEITDTGRPLVRDPSGNGSMPCYTNAFDAISVRGWHVHHNLIEGFFCASHEAGPAILFWQAARDNVVEANEIYDSSVGIYMGMGTFAASRTYSDNPCNGATPIGDYNGIVQNNFVGTRNPSPYSQAPWMDTGIGVEEGCGTIVRHNTVITSTAPFASIDWRFTNTSAFIQNNLVNGSLLPRDGANATVAGNLTSASLDLFVNGAAGDFHLLPTASSAINKGVAAGLSYDKDNKPRDSSTPSIGATEP